MTKFVLTRLFQLVVVVLVVTFVTSVVMSFLPGDPVKVIAPFADNQQREAIRADLHLDDPVPVRYVKWLGGFVTGDLGNHYTVSSTRPVADRFWPALRTSAILMLWAQFLALAMAVPAAIWSASHEGGFADRAISNSAYAALSIPGFALTLLLAYWLGVKWQVLPPSGWRDPWYDTVGHLRRVIVPAFALSLGPAAIYMRLLRTDLIATLRQDFITMARAKGLTPRRIMWRHALRASSITLLTVAGLSVGTMIGSALVVEVIFGIPGLGTLTAEAIIGLQYGALQTYVAAMAILFVVVNIGVDILYGVVDPRIRNV